MNNKITIGSRGSKLSLAYANKVKDLILDCDYDAILLSVEMVGQSACHNGTRSCFIEPDNHQMRSFLI